jgi:hypothetical protein
MLRSIGRTRLLGLAGSVALVLVLAVAVVTRVVLAPGVTAARPSADGTQVPSPGGTADVYVNSDGTASAIYRPAARADLIAKVEFWLRGVDGRWARAGSTDTPTGGAYLVVQLDGTQRIGWSTGETALSVHVVWRDGSAFVDPVPWVLSYRFETSPTTPPKADPKVPGVTPPPVAPPASAQPDDPYPEALLAGASAVCEDGTWSFERTLGQVCVHHGGVRWWTGNIGSRGPGQH